MTDDSAETGNDRAGGTVSGRGGEWAHTVSALRNYAGERETYLKGPQ